MHFTHGQRVMINVGPYSGQFGSVIGLYNENGIKNVLPRAVDWKTEVVVFFDYGVAPIVINRNTVEPTKICKKCGEERGLSQFQNSPLNKDGKENRCTVICSPVHHSLNYHLHKRLETPVSMHE